MRSQKSEIRLNRVSEQPMYRSIGVTHIYQYTDTLVTRCSLFATILLFCCFFALLFSSSSLAFAAEKWSGVDETVVEKYAKEHGREAREPLINTDQGDMLLFVFLLAGAIGGFAAGYYWRMLSEGRNRDLDVKNQLMGNG